MAFTLMELMMVVVLVGIIAAFAIPSYQKMMNKNTERSVILGLETILGLNRMYFATNRVYWPEDNTAYYFLAAMNTALGASIIEPNGITYACQTNTAADVDVHCRAVHTDGWTLNVDTTVLSGHPFCSVGTCPSCANSGGGGC